MYKNILLFGFRYCGKTTIGREVARVKKLDFSDIDEEIEKETGEKIFDLLKTSESWNNFRKIEHKIFLKLIEKENIVISCGAGAFVNDAVFDSHKTLGVLQTEIINKKDDSYKVMLEINNDSLTRRIIQDSKKRKLLSTKPDSSLDEIILENIELYEKRKKLYEKVKYNQRINSSSDEIFNIIKLFDHLF